MGGDASVYHDNQDWMGVLLNRSATWANWIELSGKMAVLAHLLAELRQKTDDRIVLVSNYTQVLHQSHVLY